MTTSYIKEAIQKLREEKKLARQAEIKEAEAKALEEEKRKKASDKRIAAKQAIIDAGGVVPNPEPVASEVNEVEVVEEKPKVKKKKSTKTATKKRGRPKGSKNKK